MRNETTTTTPNPSPKRDTEKAGSPLSDSKRTGSPGAPVVPLRYLTPQAELIALIAETTGAVADWKLVVDIIEQLNADRQTMAAYLADIKPRLTRLAARPGPGFFLSHARNFAGSARPAKIAPHEVETITQRGPVLELCPTCDLVRGKGLVIEGETVKECPDCRQWRENGGHHA